jgi:hypothetical protein
MNWEDSYRNPFSEYNANKMDSQTILNYWCNPFAFKKSKAVQSGSLSEREVFAGKNPIVFIGGRGTGKTMFLKYFSYSVQLEQAKRDANNGLIPKVSDYFISKGAIGLYVKIDGPLLRSFSGNALPQEKWDAIFAHYFELRICQALLEVIKDLRFHQVLTVDSAEREFIAQLARRLHVRGNQGLTLESLLSVVNEDIETVTSYRSDVVFRDVRFKPRQAFTSGDLFAVIKLAQEHLGGFLQKLLFPIFLDEYENFSLEQQRRINTLVKHVPDGTTFRIGMRFEGFHTYDTISKNEFIKKGRDYQEMVFEDVLIKDKDYEGFLISVAQKRLEGVPVFRENGFVSIRKILGVRADVEDEARALVSLRKTPDQHFKLLRFAPNDISIEQTKRLLACPDNPLLEMLNILWVIRGKSPDHVARTMADYLAGKDSPAVSKYRMDYVDKYKLSLMFLLCSAYRQNKQYYSFNTFTFLSSGIVGNFIELCRRAFQLAYFEDRDRLFTDGAIAPHIQDIAAKEASASELQMVTRIYEHGEILYRFVCNLGNIFRAYHTDARLKYPETNQFSIDTGALHDASLKKSFNAAVEWSVIQKKPRLQRTSPSSQRRVIYTLNRIFAPAFEITYRTRGQFSEEYSEVELRRLMMEDNVRPQVSLITPDEPPAKQEQLPLGGGKTDAE